MNISRKEFFRKSLFSLGETVYAVTGAIQAPLEADPEQLCDMPFVPVQRNDLLAFADNGLCLARGCGCFSCIESCESNAIHLMLGIGIGIDEAKCTGCGRCNYVCPVNPRAISLKPRKTV